MVFIYAQLNRIDTIFFNNNASVIFLVLFIETHYHTSPYYR